MIAQDIYYLRLARKAAESSSCQAISVGAVLVQGSLLVEACNSTPPGYTGCRELGYCYPGFAYCTDKDAPPSRAIHAEASAIAIAVRDGIPLQGSTVYTTLEPCLQCLKLIVSSGIKRIVYETPFPKYHGNLAWQQWRSLIEIEQVVVPPDLEQQELSSLGGDRSPSLFLTKLHSFPASAAAIFARIRRG